MLTAFEKTDLVTAQVALAWGYARAGPELSERALAWAARPACRGLGAGITPGWSWGAVLAQVVVVGNDDQRERATELALAPYRDLDVEAARTVRLPGTPEERLPRQRSVEQFAAAGLVERAVANTGARAAAGAGRPHGCPRVPGATT